MNEENIGAYTGTGEKVGTIKGLETECFRLDFGNGRKNEKRKISKNRSCGITRYHAEPRGTARVGALKQRKSILGNILDLNLKSS